MSERVAFIGLGVMGYPMAGHLLKKGGHQVTVYNRNAAKAEAWVKEYGGKSAPTPAAAAKDADYVFACVGDDPDVRAVTTGKDGAFESMKKGTIFVDHTTASAVVARECYAAAKARGLHFIDAPVSGGSAGAQNGVLTVMCGGDAEPYAKAEAVFKPYARMAALMGPPGAGQQTKMVNQICIAGLVQGMSEGFALAERVGLDIAKIVEVISKGAAQSWQMDNRYKAMIDGKFDFGFAVDWMRKDLRVSLEQAREVGALLPVTALVDQFYGDVQKMGGGRYDTCSLILRLRDKK